MDYDYAVLTPIGKHKHRFVQDYINAIAEFEILPRLLMICTDIDDPNQDLPYLEIPETLHQRILVFKSCAIESYSGMLWRIAMAREILRRKFNSTNIEWALWIDSDIVCPPETPRVLIDIARDENCIMIRNAYPTRHDPERFWHGTGVLLVHRVGMLSSLFWYPSEIIPHVSEDYVFISVLTNSGWFLCQNFGFKRVQRIGRYVEVKHLH